MRRVHRSVRAHGSVLVGIVLGWTAPAWAGPAAADDVTVLREELAGLKRDYEERIAALERRLASLEEASAGGARTGEPPDPAPSPAASTEALVPPGAAGAGGPTGPLPVYGGGTSKVFNPDIAVIGNVLGAAGTNDLAPRPTFEMNEAEASFQAVVDPYARADFFLAFGPEEVEIEEGFVSFPALPGGFLLKAGKLKAAFGKVNTFHTHQLSWTDRPLLLENLLGGEEGVADAGVSVSRLLPIPGLFLEATGEVYRGESTVFAAPERTDLTYLGRLRAYRDLTESTNLDLGGSFLRGHYDVGGTTRLFGADLTFRYRPLRRAIYKRLLARAELVWSRREEPAEPRQEAFGLYASVDYQLARRWFAGLRYDRSDRADSPDLTDEGGSAVLTFWPSEFSQVRAQYRHTRYGEGVEANELLLQLLFSIGAHGAHVF